ncbi:hypothetical protein AGMMS4956_02190 [Bacteroidia bacterium]|nr:hypothetical protein AGMMS4956_02190 [Bacteroidia bacterium]
MKRIIVLAATIFVTLNIFAQNEGNIKKETFDNNAFRWEEFADKKLGTVLIQDGYLTLNAKKSTLSSKTNFPIDITRDFKLTYKFLVPVLDKKTVFGLTFDSFEDEGGQVQVGFYVSEGKYALKPYNIPFEIYVPLLSVGLCEGKIPLKKGKNQNVVLSMERRGETLIFSVNNMTVCEEAAAAPVLLQTSKFGVAFASSGKSTLLVDEIIIEQADEE